MNRPLEHFALELDYWKAVGDDVGEINRLLAETAVHLVEIAPALLEALMNAPLEFDAAPITRASTAASKSMKSLKEMSDRVCALAEILDGRSTVLAEEAEDL